MRHVAGQYYHVYNRGCNREPIFCEDYNYKYLTQQAERFLPDSQVAIIAYCLMPNHCHFLLRSEKDGAVGRYIQRLFNSYTQAFNRQHSRSGTLFEGRAKSILVDDESYLIHLCRYIHLNPVVAGIADTAGDWRYSNYLDWIGKREGPLVDYAFVESYFPGRVKYTAFIEESIGEAVARKLARYCAE